MTDAISKADFSRTMGVDPSQATRWAQRGMPVLEDGRVPAAEAAEWVRLHVRDYARTARSIGAREMREAQVQQHQEGFDEIGRLALWLMAQRLPAEVAQLAIKAGASLEAAYALYRGLQRRGPQIANDVRERWLCLPESESGPFGDISFDPDPPDWAALAKAAGVRLDLGRWEKGARKRLGALPARAKARAKARRKEGPSGAVQ